MSDKLSAFKNLQNNVRSQKTGTGAFANNEEHLTRKDRKTVQINKKYYHIIRKLVFKHPETTYTLWVDRALQHALDDGIFKN